MNKNNNNNVLKNQKFKEIVSKREACVKVFENEDHSFTAAVYDHPVHYMKDGRWEEIDNRLVEGMEEAGDVENAAGEMKIRLSNRAKEKGMVRIGQGEKKLSWGLHSCEPVKREVIESEPADAAGAENGDQDDPGGGRALRKAMAVKHLTARAVYPEILPGVDASYTIQPDKMKEDIILKGPEAPHVFTWHYRTGKLTAVQEGEAVLFKDAGGEAVYQVTAPYMTDAVGARSAGVKLELLQEEAEAADGEKDGHGVKEAIVRLTADAAWLKDTERVYPVIIDPVITSSQKRSDIEDCHVSSCYSTDNFYNSHILKTGGVDGSVLRSYMKFILPAIDRTADMVVAARMYMYRYSSSSAKRYIDIHRVKGDWKSSTLTWENKPAYDEKVLDYVGIAAADDPVLSFDITGVVRDWYLNGKNYGLMIKDHQEAEGSYMDYYSSDTNIGDDRVHPHILISYVNYSGLEGYWTYHTQPAGRAGTGHVNDYNGNLIFVHDTLAMSGSRMPAVLSHVFNSNDRAVDMGYGMGWRLSCHQTIGSVEIDEVKYYQYIDGDGTAHYFRQEKEEAPWKDESGLELTLVIRAGDNANMYTITDKEDTKYIFRNSGRLSKITDAGGNTLTITYTDRKTTKLEDGSGRTVLISYGTDGRLETVEWAGTAKKVKRFAYDGNGRLTAITDVDGTVCTYAYDANGMLTKASDPYGYSLTYGYYGTAPYRVKKVSEAAGSTAGQSVSFQYGDNQTKFTDHQGRSQYYLFNNGGNTVSVRDDEGYGAAWKFNPSKANQLSQLSDLQYTPVQLLKGSHAGMTGWEDYVSHAAAVTVGEDTAQSYIGERSVRIRNADVNAYGMAVQRVDLTAGKRYVFSAYVKASAQEVSRRSAVWLQVQTADAAMTEIARTADTVPGPDRWKRLQVAFTAPGSAGSSVTVRIVARALYIKGDTWFDGFQLEEGEAASRLNLIVNNNFRYDLYGYTKSDQMDADDAIVPVGSTSAGLTLKGSVTQEGIKVRKGAGTEFDSLTSLPKNTVVPIYGADYDKDGVRWYFISCTVSGTTCYGYMMGTYLKLNGPASAVAVTAIAGGNDLNIRKGAGTGYASLIQVSRGQKMTVNGAAKDSSGVKWYKVALAKSGVPYEGYVSSEYVAVLYPAAEYGKVADTSIVNIRYGPGMDYSIATVLDRNDALTITGRTVLAAGVEWLYVSGTKDGTAFKGYVNSIYVAYTGRAVPPAIQIRPPETVPAGNGPLGDQAFMIIGDETKDKRLFYEVKVSGKAGDSYVASAWGCGHTVPLTGEDHQDRRFGIRVNFYKDTGKVDEVHYANFGADTTGWQYLSDAFVAKQDYDRIYVGYWYQNNANPAYFTGLSLFKEAFGASFTYDEKGNVLSVTDQAKEKSRFEYDSGNNLKKMTDPKGNAFTYTYDDQHNVKTAKSAANMNYAFTYDGYGHPLTSKVVNPDTPADAKTAITSKASYTASGQYMAGQTDALGSQTVYSWDEDRGLLNQVTDAGSHVTAYTYDSMDRITKVSGKAAAAGAVSDVSVQYGYEKDRLTKITHNGFDYVFAYDGFGKRTKVSVAGTALISHSYEAKNGLLAKSTYGNGWEISYSYDSLDRLESVSAKKDGVPYPLCSHIYNKQGQLARFIDGQEAGKSCSYGYDLTGRLCEAVFDDVTAFAYSYDVNDCLTEEQITTADGTRTVRRTYDADSREKGFTCGTAKVDVAYDKLGRLSTIKRNGKHTTAYTYQTAKDGGQTGQIAKVTNGSEAITYTYDARGYVTSAVKDGQTHRYQYDALGQLIREEDPVQGKTIVYIYDGGGNLTEKRDYALTTAADLTGLAYTSQTFTYGSTWRDQLTAVDGQAYSYDAIGNLLNDGKYSYTWKNGRQLAGITGNGLTAAYTYDAGGIRTSKTVNGVKTEYLTANGKVLSEKKGSTWQHYLYDGSGNLAAIRYKGADYYYVRDGLMNITGLVDGNGNTVVNYSYDSWGKLLSVTGSMAGTLGQDNPYRYKGYYYDAETGLYYIESRYYNPEIYRFISIDSLVGASDVVWGHNLYVYCNNDPINCLDLLGNLALPAKIVIGAFVNVGTSYLMAKVTGQEYTLQDGVIAAVSGAIGAINTKEYFSYIAGGISGVYTAYTAYHNGASLGGAVAAGAVSFLAASSGYSSMMKTCTGLELTWLGTAGVDTVFTSEFNAMAAVGARVVVPSNTKDISNKNSARQTKSSIETKKVDSSNNVRPSYTPGQKIKHRYYGIQE